jgi:hypothetical protein
VLFIEFLDREVELLTLLALYQQFGNFGAPLMVLWPHLSNFAFFGALAPPLIWPEGVLRELALVLGERGLGFGVPDATLVVRKVFPCETDDFGEGAVVSLDL